MAPIQVAVAQASCQAGDIQANTQHTLDLVGHAARRGAQLVVFPECGLTGYVVDTREAAQSLAISADHRCFNDLAQAARELSVHLVVGYLEKRGTHLYNSARLICPDGAEHQYTKRHLPHLGADRFTTPGATNPRRRAREAEPAVFETDLGRIGIAICYEIRFPEAIRTLALANADIVVLPTAWPEASYMLAENFAPVRAAENFVYLLVADRGDTEQGTTFLGGSQIVDPRGNRLGRAVVADDVVIAQIDPERARDKRIVFADGTFEISPWLDRRPDTYLMEPPGAGTTTPPASAPTTTENSTSCVSRS